MKIYLAAKFEQKMEMRDVRTLLESWGHEVTSQWIDVEHTEDHNIQVTDDMRIGYAQMDINDVLRADVLVTFAGERKVPAIGGGRHVEFGVAVQAGMPIIVVGPKGEHIFHYLPSVNVIPGMDQLAEALLEVVK